MLAIKAFENEDFFHGHFFLLNTQTFFSILTQALNILVQLGYPAIENVSYWWNVTIKHEVSNQVNAISTQFRENEFEIYSSIG